MRITDNAVKAIVSVMNKIGLDPKTTFMEIGLFESNLGLSFTKEITGRSKKFGELTVVTQNNVDSDQVVVDYGEIEGRTGLIFLTEEQYANNIKR